MRSVRWLPSGQKVWTQLETVTIWWPPARPLLCQSLLQPPFAWSFRFQNDPRRVHLYLHLPRQTVLRPRLRHQTGACIIHISVSVIWLCIYFRLWVSLHQVQTAVPTVIHPFPLFKLAPSPVLLHSLSRVFHECFSFSRVRQKLQYSMLRIVLFPRA